MLNRSGGFNFTLFLMLALLFDLNLRGDVKKQNKKIVVVLGGAHHKPGKVLVKKTYFFLFLLPFDPEASKVFKNS